MFHPGVVPFEGETAIVAITVNKFQIPSNKNAQVHPMAPKPSGPADWIQSISCPS